MCNPFDGGSSGPTSSGTAASSSNQTVNVAVSTPVTVDTSDLADAISALSGQNGQSATLQLIGTEYAAKTAAAATVQAAQLSAGPSAIDVILVIVAILGFLVTAGVLKIGVQR